MKIGSYDFSLRELSGAMGDFGTLLPLAIGYIAICGLNPAGLLVTMGLANIVTGIIYRLPMPIEPMKVLAVVAISQGWTPSLIYAAGFGMGLTWVIFSMTGFINYIAKVTPNSVIRGIQVSLGIILSLEAFKMLSSWWVLGIMSVAIVIIFRENRYAPAAIILVLLGLGIIYFSGELSQGTPLAVTLPPLTIFQPMQVWEAMILAGFAQIPLTATNAVISTSSLIKTYFPDRHVTENRLALNMGLMNLALPFFGGMPLCHGAGGLAGQYYFGARTGGANILEGSLEIIIGILLATSIAGIFVSFPMAIIGAMMLMVGFEMVKFARDVSRNWELSALVATVIVSVLTNMALGFLAGMIVYYSVSYFINTSTGKV